MPITYKVSKDGLFVYTAVTGKVTEQDLLQYEMDFLSDPRIKPGFRNLLDVTTGIESQLTKETVDKIISIDKAHPEKFVGSKCAIVVSSSTILDFAQEFEKLHNGVLSTITFVNSDVAETWLGYRKNMI